MTQKQIVTALQALRPGAQWSMAGDTYASIAWQDTTHTIPTEAEIVACVPPAPPSQVLSQDLMAQFTVADFTAIKAAVANSDNFGLLWASLQAQKDPMIITKPRFKAGWAALVQVLGQPRMTVIATALGVTII
jgi:hypothetical protein